MIVAHSHLLVQHLLRQLERHAAECRDRNRRPEWLASLVDSLADLFEPLAGISRVGYDCEYVDDAWEARLYLGPTEIVGGKHDGAQRHLSFEVDVQGVLNLLERVHEVRWTVSGGDANSSFLTVTGESSEEPVRIKLYSRAPRDAGPALRELPDGSLEDPHRQ